MSRLRGEQVVSKPVHVKATNTVILSSAEVLNDV